MATVILETEIPTVKKESSQYLYRRRATSMWVRAKRGGG